MTNDAAATTAINPTSRYLRAMLFMASVSGRRRAGRDGTAHPDEPRAAMRPCHEDVSATPRLRSDTDNEVLPALLGPREAPVQQWRGVRWTGAQVAAWRAHPMGRRCVAAAP